MSRRWFHVVAAVSALLAEGAVGQQRVAAQTLNDATTIASVIESPLADGNGYLGEVTPVSHLSEAGATDCGDTCGLSGDRWYLGLSGGWQQRETVHEVEDARTFIIFDSGFLVNAQVGYHFDVFRVEAEYSFMNNDVDRAGAVGFDTPSSGNVNLKAFMFNVYHDFTLFDWLWEPYVGAGLGVYQSEINSLYPEFFAGAGPDFAGMPVNTTSNMPFAYQFRAGMSRPVGRRTDLLIGYRFFKGEELEFAAAPFATPPAPPTFHPDGAAIHNLEVGLRVRF